MRSFAAIVGVLAALAQGSASIEGLWAYETIARGGGQPVSIAGLFVFKDGSFVQQSINVGEPFDAQLAQAHAGTYHLDTDHLRMVAEQGIVVDPGGRTRVEFRDGTVHEVAVHRRDEAMTLTFGTGTVQSFKRVGPGRGEIVHLEHGALALVDGHFLFVAEAPDHATSGSGTVERQGNALRLRAERWLSIREGHPSYSRDRVIEGQVTPAALTIAGEVWPVRRPISR